jgi:hypothetical protein
MFLCFLELDTVLNYLWDFLAQGDASSASFDHYGTQVGIDIEHLSAYLISGFSSEIGSFR